MKAAALRFSWALLLWSGLVALVLSSWLLMVLRQVGATRYLPRAYWSCALFRRTGDFALLMAGLVRSMAMVGVFPVVYALVFMQAGRAEAPIGAIAGLLHGLLAGALLPFAARRCSGVRTPGPLGWNLGRATPVVLLIVHALYGTVLGYLYVLPVP